MPTTWKPTEAELRLQAKLDEHLDNRARLAGCPQYAINRGVHSWWNTKENGAMRVLRVEHNGARRSFQLPAKHADRGFTLPPTKQKGHRRKSVRKQPAAAAVVTVQPTNNTGVVLNTQSFAELMTLADLILERDNEEIKALFTYVNSKSGKR